MGLAEPHSSGPAVCDAPRGQKDLAKFARRLTQAQRRVLGFRRNDQGRYPAPSQSTFSRLLKRVDGTKVNETLLAIQEKMRGKPPKEDLIVMDGKEPRQGTATPFSARSPCPANSIWAAPYGGNQ